MSHIYVNVLLIAGMMLCMLKLGQLAREAANRLYHLRVHTLAFLAGEQTDYDLQLLHFAFRQNLDQHHKSLEEEADELRKTIA